MKLTWSGGRTLFGALLVACFAERTSGFAAAEPELPRNFIDTNYTPPGGRVIAVPAGGDLQAALDQVQPGETITLAAGATYTGNFTLPAKAGSGWIVLRTSAPDKDLPLPGTRMHPELARSLPKIVTPNSRPAFAALDEAQHYRLIGLEFAQAAGVKQTYTLISLGEGQTSLRRLPRDLILDRLYIHGSPTTTVRRGVTLNSASTAIIDSYIADCHEEGADSQAVGGWNGPGPFKIVNNYLEGAGENFLLGGADPTIPNLVSSDIEFRRNHCFKPLSWRIGDPHFAGRPWVVKNLFELKNAQRVLVEGNLFENNWTHGQNGFAILFTVRNQDGKAPWAVVQDVTFIHNVILNSGSGFNMHGRDDNYQSSLSQRIRIAHNLLTGIDGARLNSGGVAFQMIGGPDDLIIEHNTVLHTGNILASGQPNQRLVFNNNLFPQNEYGVKGDGRSTGNDTLKAFFPGVDFRRNVIVGGQAKDYPSDNFFPVSLAAVGFVNLAHDDHRLASASPFKNAGTDGRDIGCDDFDRLQAVRETPQKNARSRVN